MEIVLGKTAGFCFGVKNAVDKTIKEAENNKNIYCLGELVHNSIVTEVLQKKGVRFIENIEEGKNKVIIRAHGVPKEVYKKAEEMGLELKDLTCPKVLHIHNIANSFKEKNYFIFLVGKKNHPETIGTISFCGENAIIIENTGNISDAIEQYKKSKLKNAIVLAQTTYSLDKFNSIVNLLKEKIKNLEVQNTICDATRKRQEETKELSKIVDMMIIIGGKHSSNTTKLYEIATANCKNVLFIEDKNELKIDNINKIKKIGIMAGASTPAKSIDEVVEILTKM